MICVRAPTELACSPGYDDLKQAFIDYKSGRCLPDIIGKDAPYHRPQSAADALLEHIHLSHSASGWTARHSQAKRTSDKHLVYCRHYFSQNNYLLIAVLDPNAHELADKVTFMCGLVEVAEKFHAIDYSA